MWAALTLGFTVGFSSSGRGYGSLGGRRGIFMDANYFGGDPRASVGAVVADDAWASTLRPGSVAPLCSVGQLQAALDAASPFSALVVLKFERQGCKACVSTEEPFARMAKGLGKRTGSHFFTVDTLAHKEFCRDQVGVKAVPCAHIYQEGDLKHVLPISKRKWPAFRKAVSNLLSDRRSHDQGPGAVVWRWIAAKFRLALRLG